LVSAALIVTACSKTTGESRTKGPDFDGADATMTGGSDGSPEASDCAPNRVLVGDVVVHTAADLAALRCVEELRGRLRVTETELQDLAGLERLGSVEGLTIDGNARLGSFSGLGALTTITSGGLTVTGNPELRDLHGLDGLETVHGVLLVEGYERLGALSGAVSLRAVLSAPNVTPANGAIIVRYNPTLVSLRGLEFLREAGTLFHVCGNPALTGVIPLPAFSGPAPRVNVIYNASLDAEAARVFADSLGALEPKIVANGATAFTPPAECPWRGDDVCDESAVFIGDALKECTGLTCCDPEGPTRLCQDGSDAPEDCPPPQGMVR
jgi:hypothetical protein